jgi:hypothetical protein
MNLFQLSIVFCLCLQVFALSKEKSRAFFRQLLVECQEQEGGTEADLAMLSKGELSESNSGKCMVACTFEIIGIVRKT